MESAEIVEMSLDSLACRICGHSQAAIDRIDAHEMMYGSMVPFTYLRCGACKTLQISNVPNDLGRYYANESYYSFKSNKAPSLSLRQRAMLLVASRLFVGTAALRGGVLDRLLGRYIPMWASAARGLRRDAKVIDIGCGDGALLDKMKSWGFTDLHGSDPFLAETKFTPGGIALKSTPIEDLPTASYDVLILMHSFEHVPDPIAFLEHIRRVVRDDGLVVLEIPVSQGVPFETYREHWVHLDAPRHLHLFTADGFRRLARQHGLVPETQGFASTAFSVLGSALYRSGSPMHLPDGTSNFGRYSPSDWAVAERVAAGYNETGRGDTAFFVMRPC